MGRVNSFGLGDIANPNVKAQLTEKFPPRKRPLPHSVSKLKPIDGFRELRQSLLSLNPGTAPGSGGLRNEFLTALGERMTSEELRKLEEFGLAYTAGELPNWFYVVWQSLQTVAPFKNKDKKAVRPLGLKNSLTKLFNKEVMAQSKPEIRAFLEPVQLGLSVYGAALLTRSVSGIMHMNLDFICFKLDLKNAFNEMSRRAVLDVLNKESTLKHLVTFAAAILSPESALESNGEIWGKMCEGMGQGDPPSGDFFSIGLQPDLIKLDEACKVGGGQARAGHDDIFAQGPASIVIPAVIKFAQDIQNRCHLELQWNKSCIFSWTGVLPEGCPKGVELAGKMVDGNFEVGIDCYGVPLGSQKYITSELMEMAKEVASDAVKTRQVLSTNKQAYWSALRLSISQRFQYLCQHVAPSLCEPVAEWLDNQLWKELETLVGIEIPKGNRGQEGDLVIKLPIDSLNGMSYQEWVIRLPVKLHGWGFRSLREICAPAYLGTLETSVSRMKEISPSLVEIWGGEDYWGSRADFSQRWSKLLSSNCLEAFEVQRAWDLLTAEASKSAEWLGIEIEQVFNVPLIGIGDGSVNGNTRTEIVSARERTRVQLLDKALSLHLPKKTRPAWAWRQRDKLSSSWLLALPGPESHLNNAEFSEAAASSLCLPSPACLERLGEVIRNNKKVDQYGDNVQACPLPGDHWRKRHDLIKK